MKILGIDEKMNLFYKEYSLINVKIIDSDVYKILKQKFSSSIAWEI